jgi:hypothetical protein
MADFTITISNNLYAFGPDKLTPSLWGTFQWGGYWAYEAIDLICEVEKAISNAITPSEAVLTFEVDKLFQEAITPSDEYIKDTERTIENTLSPSFETSDETLTNGTWDYVFIKPSANAENRNLATFTTQSNASTTWSSGTATSTSWS